MKKTIALLSVLLLTAGSFPLPSLAEEMNQLATTEQVQESTTASSESTEESTTSSSELHTDPSTENTVPPSVTAPPENKPQETPETQASQDIPTPNEPVPPVESVPIVPTETTELPESTTMAVLPTEKNQTTEEFVKSIGNQAREVATENNLYASVMIAQAILESGSGSSELAEAPYYNLFGIKGEFEGESVSFPTFEDDGSGNMYQVQAAFRSYPSIKESLQDYAGLLKGGVSWNEAIYQGTWKSIAKTYQEATESLTGSYATDIQYNAKLNGLIEAYQLTKYDFPEGSQTDTGTSERAETVIEAAKEYLGVPYVWGGTTPQGFDCSGLVQYVFNNAVGVPLLRVTTQQETQGTPIDLSAIQPGDLLFWGEVGATYHVGIYVGNGAFIHAPEPNTVVRIDRVADYAPDFAQRVL